MRFRSCLFVLALVLLLCAPFRLSAQVLGDLDAPNREDVVRAVLSAHPEINACDKSSLDRGRAVIVDWTAQRLNKEAGVTRWGRKSRGVPRDGRAVNPNTDGLTYLRSDGRFEIYDVIIGAPKCSAAWQPNGPFGQGQNGYFAPPQLGPEPGTTTPPPPVVTPPPAPVACDTSKAEKAAADAQAASELSLEVCTEARDEIKAHRAAVKDEYEKQKSWARRWIVEKALPIVGGILAGKFGFGK